METAGGFDNIFAVFFFFEEQWLEYLSIVYLQCYGQVLYASSTRTSVFSSVFFGPKWRKYDLGYYKASHKQSDVTVGIPPYGLMLTFYINVVDKSNRFNVNQLHLFSLKKGQITSAASRCRGRKGTSSSKCQPFVSCRCSVDISATSVMQ